MLAALLLANGCHSPQPSCLDHYARLAAYPIDTSPIPGGAGQAGEGEPLSPTRHPAPSPSPGAAQASTGGSPDAQRAPGPLQLPPELPGADAPPLRMPALSPDATDAARRAAVQGLYAPLPDIHRLRGWDPDIAGRTLTLEALQAMALENSPALQQSAADVETARGAMIQAGAYPNPELGYESDTVGTAGTRGYQGGYVGQTVVTAGKLRLAESAAAVDVDNAQLAVRRARVTVASRVSRAYFRVLVARERFKLARALARFTERAYQAQIELVEGGESAPYEPMQLRVLSLQARATVVQALRQYQAAWRQLAAAVGLPELTPSELAGRPDMPVPVIGYEQALSVVLAEHTDLLMAANSVGQARTRLRLAEVAPIPNIDTTVAIQHDFTFDPGTTTYNLQIGGALPVFNANRGGIISSRAQVYRAEQTVIQLRNDLTAQLADAFARYATSQTLIASYQTQALQDQVRAYRGVYERYRSDPAGLQFNDVVVAQQTLAGTLTQYIDLLGDQWDAVVDMAELMQVDDLLTLGQTVAVAGIPELGDDDSPDVPTPARTIPPQPDGRPRPAGDSGEHHAARAGASSRAQ